MHCGAAPTGLATNLSRPTTSTPTNRTLPILAALPISINPPSRPHTCHVTPLLLQSRSGVCRWSPGDVQRDGHGRAVSDRPSFACTDSGGPPRPQNHTNHMRRFVAFIARSAAGVQQVHNQALTLGTRPIVRSCLVRGLLEKADRIYGGASWPTINPTVRPFNLELPFLVRYRLTDTLLPLPLPLLRGQDKGRFRRHRPNTA